MQKIIWEKTLERPYRTDYRLQTETEFYWAIQLPGGVCGGDSAGLRLTGGPNELGLIMDQVVQKAGQKATNK